MPTICGVRRRGYTPEAIRKFCERIGVSKFDGVIDMSWLEDALREDLNKKAPRVMGVLRPLKVVIENYPDGQTEEIDRGQQPGRRVGRHAEGAVLEGALHRAGRLPREPAQGFLPPRARPRSAVPLRVLRQVHGVVKDAAGNVVELRCTYDPATKGGDAPDGRKVKGTIHWVSADTAVDAEVRLYDHLFASPTRTTCRRVRTYLANLNPKSLEVLTGVQAGAEAGDRSDRRARSSSSGSATSAWTRIRSRHWSSTAR